MSKEKFFALFSKEQGELLQKDIEKLVIIYLAKHRERLVADYIKRNFSKFMAEDRLLTSEEVMRILKISRQTFGRRVKSGALKPVNPEAKRHYRFKKSDIDNYIERKGGVSND